MNVKIRSNGWRIVRKLRTYKDGFAFTFASGFGSGLFPVAAGTSGSFAALILVVLLTPFPVIANFIFWILLFFAGLWGITHLDRRFQIRDPGFVVIDEWIGMAIAAAAIPQDRPLLYVIAFFTFRFFDIVKPGPIKKLDLLSKKQDFRPLFRAFWVIADDLAAGLVTFAIIQSLIHWTKIS